MTYKLFLVAGLIGVLSGGLATYMYKDNQILKLKTDHARQAQKQLTWANNKIDEQVREQEALREQLALLETTRYKELTDAQKSINKLSGDLRDARERLSVRTTNSVRSDSLSSTGTSTSLDAEEVRADIHPEDSAAIVRLTGEADECAITLTALQDRVLKEREPK